MNEHTWQDIPPATKQLYQEMFGDHKIDPSIPDGYVSIMHKGREKIMPVERANKLAERAARKRAYRKGF